MKNNPYKLLKLAQEIKELFNGMVNKNTKYNEVISVKNKYFSQVDGDYSFEGSVFKIGCEKARAMLDELKALEYE